MIILIIIIIINKKLIIKNKKIIVSNYTLKTIAPIIGNAISTNRLLIIQNDFCM